MKNKKIKSFTDLDAWREAHKLAVFVYKSTKEFPKEEQYGLVSQMRRCGVSIVSNIAEGFSRESDKEKIRFYQVSIGSLMELQSQLLIARDIGHVVDNEFSELASQTVKVQMLVNGMVRHLRKIPNT